MSELGDDFRIIKEMRQKKRWNNHNQSLRTLSDRGIPVQELNRSCSHYRIGVYDFWPTTGTFINRETKNKGRGVFNLIRLIELRQKTNE